MDEPGDVIAVALAGSALAASAILVRRGQRPISTCVRTTPALRAVAVFLLAHVVFTLPHDPLSAIGRRISRA